MPDVIHFFTFFTTRLLTIRRAASMKTLIANVRVDAFPSPRYFPAALFRHAHANRASTLFDFKSVAGDIDLFVCPGIEPKAHYPLRTKEYFRHAGRYKHGVWLGFDIGVYFINR
jgi:hypothetical protein